MVTQRLCSFKFTLVNKSHSQHSVVVVRCEGRHFVILYACAHMVLFPDDIMIVSLGTRLVHKRNRLLTKPTGSSGVATPGHTRASAHIKFTGARVKMM